MQKVNCNKKIICDLKECYYEGVFLNEREIIGLFESIRGKTPPLKIMPTNYHVTTEFMPKSTHPEWYGEKVNIHIYSYKVQDIAMDNGNLTSNEGFKVDITSDKKELNAYFKSISKNYHITGSYNDHAKYTEYVDFADGELIDVDVTGTFGCEYSDGIVDIGS